MSTDNASTPRREFLGQLATAAVTIAGVAACAPAALSHATPAPVASPGATAAVPPVAPSRKWDDAWATRLTAKHRAVFDAPDIAEGTIVGNAFVYMRGYHEVYDAPDQDIQAVLVVRHRAVPLVLADALWEKYDLGKAVRLKDEKTGRWARRNPFATVDAADPDAIPGLSLAALHERGAIILGCYLALMRLARQLAAKSKQDVVAVRAELRGGLLPGVEVVPSGVFAVMRAQEAGCTYMRST